MKGPRFFASSLKAPDSAVAAKLYAEVFSGQILRSSHGHSEVVFSEVHLLVFSQETEDCPVTPGTVVWKISKREQEELRQRLERAGFRKETDLEKYSSYLDPWGNRNWIYPDSEDKDYPG